MGKNTGIEWTDSTWNPIRGCSRVSEGCRNCYAEKIAARFSGPGMPYRGLATFKGGEARWTGEVRLIEGALEEPLRWKEPRKIFVNSMSDLFHPGVRDEWLASIFDVMARAPQHTYQILTKRPDRMLDAFRAAENTEVRREFERAYSQVWPPVNWWFGVSVEDQTTAGYRLPILLQCPAAIRFISYEPALGPIDFAEAVGGAEMFTAFDWLICGGESGPHARPMRQDWVRAARDLCQQTGVAFFFKQWGEWLPYDNLTDCARACMSEGVKNDTESRAYRVGKLLAGASLDGTEWKQFPRC